MKKRYDLWAAWLLIGVSTLLKVCTIVAICHIPKHYTISPYQKSASLYKSGALPAFGPKFS